ncbi:MAG: Rpn family recombination-promoting nuclease/putative transposase, partial [Lachnospiraceae bacterium]|nr:Rpn family recombination-promoting nuclease/putative transposase [Lachnospiraceae bacterium]
ETSDIEIPPELQERKKKEFQNLNLSDDFLFGMVMSNPEVCRITLEKILGIQIESIEIPIVEYTIKSSHEQKGVRLDVYIRDVEGNIYNCEMQNGRKRDLPKRARYYHSIMDTREAEKGSKYKDLTKAFVIFICTFDLFGRGRHMYTFERICHQEPDLVLGDETYTVFLNTEWKIHNGISNEMMEFLAYVKNSNDTYPSQLESDWVKLVHRQVSSIKMNRVMEGDYMLSTLRDYDKIEEGREIGWEEGRLDGRLEGLSQGLSQGLSLGLSQGKSSVNRLNEHLLRNNMLDELKRSLIDTNYQEELLQLYSFDENTFEHT